MQPIARLISSISSAEAQECVHQVIHHFVDRPCHEVHFTATGGGDLRVRVWSQTGHPRQNIFTMKWQPKKGSLFCRIYLDSACLPPMPSFKNARSAKVTSQKEPLLTEFDYVPCMHNGALLNAIEAAVASWKSAHTKAHTSI